MDYSELIKKVKSSIAFVLTEDGTGSGFIFQEKNILVTCNHVINGCTKIMIRFPDSDFINAKIIIKDEEHDLALLSFDDSTREPLLLSKQQSVKEGMSVIFSGYPLGINNLTSHQGIISAITKDATGVMTYAVDGTVNGGNSGCPLMNTDGEVLGVINAMRIERNDLLNKVREMEVGAIKLHDTDIVDILKAIIRNLQLGIGYAVPAAYIPERKIVKPEENEYANK